VNLNEAKRMKTLGQIAYEAYCNHTGWKSLVSGAPLPVWKDLDKTIKIAWEVAGKAANEVQIIE